MEIVAITAAAGGFWYWYFRRRENRLMNRLQELLDQAMAWKTDNSRTDDGENGKEEKQENDIPGEKFALREISESKFSALENGMKQYLDESLLAREKQQRQKEIIQGLISDIAHQTLTPVANLKLYAELLGEELEGDWEELYTIREQAEKLDFLIQSLVKLSRMENGIIALHPQKTAVSDLLNDIRQEYEGKAGEKGIALIMPEPAGSDTGEQKAEYLKAADTDTLTAVFDRKWTGEAVGNIVDNSLKYTKEGGKVKITVCRYSFFVRIDIEDNGIGIEEGEMNRIFSRFYRSHAVNEQPGVGIGLYLAREIIRAQKGYIKARSELGKGSVFSVFLPVSG